MKKIIYLFLVLFTFGLNAQNETYSIEYEKHKVGVFNPEKEINHSLNPKKFEHITGYFREELAKTILNAVKTNQIKIYDERKRELSIDSVANKIITFEKNNFNNTLKKEDVWDFIVPYVSAYDFEEGVKYDYKTLTIEKKVLAYCPYLVRYKSFNGEKNDSVQMPLFWIFLSKNELPDNSKKITNSVQPILNIPDTVLSLLPLKYPVKMPFTLSLFDNLQNKKINIYRSNGEEFKTVKELEDLLVLKKNVSIYDEETGQDILKTVYTDIVPEDIEAIRIAETWSINPNTLEILKKVQYFLPLYPYDEDIFMQLGVRIKLSN